MARRPGGLRLELRGLHRGGSKIPLVLADVSAPGWFDRVKAAGLDCSQAVDYLSFDIDDSTVKAISLLPFRDVQFKVITIEHDKYRFGQSAQDAIQQLLTRYGYLPVCTNVQCPTGESFEDWFVHPAHVNAGSVAQYVCDSIPYPKLIDSVLLWNPWAAH